MKLKTIIGYTLVGVGGYYLGKMGLAYWRERAGQVVSKVIPKGQQALAAGYTQGMAIVKAALAQAGIQAQVTPGTADGKPALVVSYTAGTDTAYADSYVPPVAAGIQVVTR
jgi:hypothetical protein